MQERYLRNIPALTEEECRLLQQKRVLVVGCGGLGGNLISILLRIGVGNLRIVDGDVFEATNLNRQLFSSIPALGHNKARIAAQRASNINPDIALDVVEEFFTEENARRLLQDCDIALDALERVVKACPVLEINTGAISRKKRDIPYPADFILSALREMGGKIILGADTHAADTIDCAFPMAVDIAKKNGFDTLLTLWPDGFHEEKI